MKAGTYRPGSDDAKQFWQLYQYDLIGVESPEVASAMIAFGNMLKTMEAEGNSQNHTKELQALLGNLEAAIQRDLNPHPTAAAATQPTTPLGNG